jgi:tetratricopeptide (TPR) repeat protein
MVKIIKAIVTALLISTTSSLAAIESTPQSGEIQLKKLLNQAKVATAKTDFVQLVQLLEKHELSFAGNANFDYYLGVGYLELSRYSDAIFALDRAVSANPKFAGAKFELARAHFYSGDLSASKIAFEQVLALKPPQALQSVITGYLRAIETKRQQFDIIHKPSIALSFGYDSNANSAPDIDFYQGVFLADKNKQSDSTYLTLHLSDFYSRPVIPDLLWQSQGSIYARKNPAANYVDMQLYIAQTGLKWLQNDMTYSIDLGFSQSNVEGEPLDFDLAALNLLGIDYQTENLERKGGYLNLKAQKKLNSTNTVSAHFKYAQSRHDPILAVRDMDQYLLDLTYTKQVSRQWLLTADVIFAEDKAQQADSPYANKRVGFMFAADHAINNKVLSRIALKSFSVDYEGLFLSQTRRDKQTGVDVSLNWLANLKTNYWTKLSWFENTTSNSLDLYQFNKTSIEFGVNYKF